MVCDNRPPVDLTPADQFMFDNRQDVYDLANKLAAITEEKHILPQLTEAEVYVMRSAVFDLAIRLREQSGD